MHGDLDWGFLVRFDNIESYALRILSNGDREIFSFLYSGGCSFSYFDSDRILTKISQTHGKTCDFGDGDVADGFQYDY